MKTLNAENTTQFHLLSELWSIIRRIRAGPMQAQITPEVYSYEDLVRDLLRHRKRIDVHQAAVLREETNGGKICVSTYYLATNLEAEFGFRVIAGELDIELNSAFEEQDMLLVL